MAEIPLSSIEYIFNHVAFPPRLPQQEENELDILAGDQDMIRVVSDELKDFARKVSPLSVASDCWAIVNGLESIQKIESELEHPKRMLYDQLKKMSEHGLLAIRVRAQNAALIFRRSTRSTTIECFELSPDSLSVMKSKGSLQRQFPAHAVEIKNGDFDDVQFQNGLACFIHRLDVQSATEMIPAIRKTSQEISSAHEPAKPSLVTEMLMTILATIGKPVPLHKIQKRYRDDVLCSGNARPWRRSTLWLLLKITVHSTLVQCLGYAKGTLAYKNFMVVLLAGFLRRSLRLRDDDRHILRTKIGRRVYKLRNKAHPFTLKASADVINHSKRVHESHWNAAVEYDSQRPTAISTRTLLEDTYMTLDKCSNYVQRIMEQGPSETCPKIAFAPSHQHLVIFLDNGLPQLASSALKDDELIFALTNIETWILTELRPWTTSAPSEPTREIFQALRNLALHYKDLAKPLYEANAEQSSVMILTIAAIWWCLDILACRQIPLLNNYSPEVPKKIFCPLILPQKEHMELLTVIEAHVVARTSSADTSLLSIFDNPFKTQFDSHFTTRYCESDPAKVHKNLRKGILAKARRAREQRRAMWQNTTAEYRRLLAEAERLECISLDEVEIGDIDVKQHDRDCKRCWLKKKAEKLTIEPLEWPLPKDKNHSKSVVFELDCPPAFGAWRDVTWMIIGDLGIEASTDTAKPELDLWEYEVLQKEYRTPESSIVLASTAPALSKARSKLFHFPVEEDGLFPENGLNFCYLDRPRSVWVHQARAHSPRPTFERCCLSQLPNGKYEPLQRFVNTVGHSQNEVLASQVFCPSTMSLHEYLAFGSLRADGELTQWSNISRELYGAALTFNTQEVCTLITHAAWQVGSATNEWTRNSHTILTSANFCSELLDGLRILLSSIQENWKNDYILQILIILLQRVLGLNSDPFITDQCLLLLSQCRETSRQWMMALKDKIDQSDDEQKLTSLRNRLLRAIFLCRMTYDMESGMLELLINNTTDLKTWNVSSILLSQNFPPDKATLGSELATSRLRDCKLAWRAWSTMTANLETSTISASLTAAVGDFYRGCFAEWVPCEPPNSRWYETTAGKNESSRVSFNVLEGHVLIDGKPLGRLPMAYVESEAYRKLFGQRTVPVYLSDSAEMHFTSTQVIHGYHIYFGHHDGFYRIQMRNEAKKEFLEILPKCIFDEDMPTIFVTDYIHLLNQSTGTVEFRPLTDQWRCSGRSWHLTFMSDRQGVLVGGEKKLIDVHSQTFLSVLQVFDHLEERDFTHVFLSSSAQLRVELPRFGLEFTLNPKGQLESRELRMIIDNDQSMRTLIGLRNRLVLCNPYASVQGVSCNLERVVIIPLGRVAVHKDKDHVSVEIINEGRAVSYCSYYIDEIFPQLRGDGSTISELHQIYLHAVTSSLLADPLLQGTGTNEALRLLRRQLNSIIAPIPEREQQLLQLIRALTPERSYCPQSNEKMHHVVWEKELSPLVQHDDFALLGQEILRKGARFALFYPKYRKCDNLQHRGHPHLSVKARNRNSGFRIQEARHSLLDPRKDDEYATRTATSSSARIRNVFAIASYIKDWDERKPHTSSLIEDLRQLGTISGFEKPLTFETTIPDLLQLDIGARWGSLCDLCCSSNREEHIFKLQSLFGTIAYRAEFGDLEDLKTLVAFVIISSIRDIPAPSHTSYEFAAGSSPDLTQLKSFLERTAKPFKYSRTYLPTAEKRREKAPYEAQICQELDRASALYFDQWPCNEPSMINTSGYTWLRIEKAHEAISLAFCIWSKNEELEKYLSSVQTIFDELRVAEEVPLSSWSGSWPRIKPYERSFPVCDLPSVITLMDLPAPTVFPQATEFKQSLDARPAKRNLVLRKIFQNISLKSPSNYISKFRQSYRDSHFQSLDCFEASLPSQDHGIPGEDLAHHILRNYREGAQTYNRCLKHLLDALGPNPSNDFSLLLALVGLWPRPPICDLLGLLSPRTQGLLRLDWRSAFVAVGISLTGFQRARRMLLSLARNDRSALVSELDNYRSVNLIPYPQWLLIEIEGDFRVREIQRCVATEMITPSSGRNNLSQVSMGEGKTSVIIPLILSALANGQDLCRLLVPKPLVRQMHVVLARRLCGLVDLPLYFMPFCREIDTTEENLSTIEDLFYECFTNYGALLAQPEHILSFKLMVRKKRIYGPMEIAIKLQDIQQLLVEKSRDVLDESDEILDPRFQLIYMLGHQKHLDGVPDRWVIIQTVLHLVEVHATILHSQNPGEIKVTRRSSAAFPMIDMRTPATRKRLIDSILDSINQGSLPLIGLQSYPWRGRIAIRHFISDPDVSTIHCDEVKAFASSKPALLKTLLLLRGLIAHGILLHAITEKRWSVDYGLHPTRCKSAVPYRAHEVPAVSAEYAQPEIYLLLTCLSYYYQGLSAEQMKQCFDFLTQRDDPSHDFTLWIRRCDRLPHSVRDYRAINIDDESLFENSIYPQLRFSKAMADFYLSHIVFPREAKEFSYKLSTSGWDIPLAPTSTNTLATLNMSVLPALSALANPSTSATMTTGFSGTSDNSFLLPSNIWQRNLPELELTNAKILDAVLKIENRQYRCFSATSQDRSAVQRFLKKTMEVDPHIRMIIDVGAQVIGVANSQIVEQWLQIMDDVEAGVYFDANDNLMVINRDNESELLAVSSFRMRMDVCVVFLDEVHTRGSDLKLPKNTRAAVTLGPRLTKDRLVQGCLRLRDLGHGQSLMFLAPPAVDLDIRKCNGKSLHDEIDGSHVIHWALEQSCLHIERYDPLHKLHGLNYHHHCYVAEHNPLTDDTEPTIRLADSPLVETETQNLCDLYAPPAMGGVAEPKLITNCRMIQDPNIQEALKDWDSLQPGTQSGVSTHEEHEREIAQEVEQQTHIERPGQMTPVEPEVDPNLDEYIRQGSVTLLEQFAPVHDLLVTHSSAARELFESTRVWKHLRGTTDFANVVETWDHGAIDATLRPVNWILISTVEPAEGHLLLISQYEANRIFKKVSKLSAQVRLYTYDPVVSHAMKIRNPQLTVLSDNIHDQWSIFVPPHITRELHLFSGQLYIKDYDEYMNFKAELDGALGDSTQAPLPFYREWVALRRRGQDILPTHVGQIVEGRTLQRSAFELGKISYIEDDQEDSFMKEYDGSKAKSEDDRFKDEEVKDEELSDGEGKNEEDLGDEDVKDEDLKDEDMKSEDCVKHEYSGLEEEEEEFKGLDIKIEDEDVKDESPKDKPLSHLDLLKVEPNTKQEEDGSDVVSQPPKIKREASVSNPSKKRKASATQPLPKKKHGKKAKAAKRGYDSSARLGHKKRVRK